MPDREWIDLGMTRWPDAEPGVGIDLAPNYLQLLRAIFGPPERSPMRGGRR